MMAAERLEDSAQLELSPAMDWQRKASKLRGLLNRAIAANQLTHEFLARETGVDERQIGRCLKDDGGAHPPLALIACVLWNDRGGLALTSLGAMLGYEVTPRRPDLSAENRRLREALAAAVAALQSAVQP